MILLAQLVYTACVLVVAVAIVALQANRHREAKACIWYGYTVLLIGLAWDGVEVWVYGPPDLLASRWLIVPSLAVIFAGAALRDWLANGRTPFATLKTWMHT